MAIFREQLSISFYVTYQFTLAGHLLSWGREGYGILNQKGGCSLISTCMQDSRSLFALLILKTDIDLYIRTDLIRFVYIRKLPKC